MATSVSIFFLCSCDHVEDMEASPNKDMICFVIYVDPHINKNDILELGHLVFSEFLGEEPGPGVVEQVSVIKHHYFEKKLILRYLKNINVESYDLNELNKDSIDKLGEFIAEKERDGIDFKCTLKIITPDGVIKTTEFK